MHILPSDPRLFAPATLRNRHAIATVLKQWLPPVATVLEIAAGTGEHATFFAAACPDWQWHPSDTNPQLVQSIRAWKAHAPAPNLHDPLQLDVSQHPWPMTRADAVVAINLLHISPGETTQQLMRGASATLAPGGLLVVYGPFFVAGVPTAPSNLAFDESLRQEDLAWGVRPLEAVDAAARQAGFQHRETVAMPANNLCVIWEKRADYAADTSADGPPDPDRAKS